MEIRAFVDQSHEGGEIGRGLFRRPGFLTKREKGLGVAPRHPRRECLLIRQRQPLETHRPAAPL